MFYKKCNPSSSLRVLEISMILACNLCAISSSHFPALSL